MSKIKIITDSASDIPKEYEEKYGIDIRCFPITVGEKSFHDRDITPTEYYDMIDACPTLPVHSQLTVFDFEKIYKQYDKEGYTDIFFVSINSNGSATYQNACISRDNYIKENPKSQLKIRVLDSTCYSGAYGYPVIEACKMIESGKSADEIEAFLTEWFSDCVVYLGCYTLRYVKKSGRISAAAAFAGEILGLKPLILLKSECSKVVAKVRGEQNVAPKLADIVCENIIENTPYAMICGRCTEQAKAAAKLIEQKLGYPPVEMTFEIGGAVASNSGPDMIAVAFRAKK